ncbi:MAG: ABC transporter ATP-binding protein [Vicinamibacterales bacterium]
MLELLDVWRSFSGTPVVRGLTLTARPGTVTALLGPNGSGKSTTVRMVVGLLQPTRGSIRWSGVAIDDCRPAYQRRLGYVPEEARLYGHLTAAEFLSLVGGLRGVAHRTLAGRIERYLDLLELQIVDATPLAAYSKGMRQKVLIAAALLDDPDLVVLDEPNSGLDVGTSLVLQSLVSTLAARGKVVVYCSHLLDVVEKVCDHVVILHRGRVVAAGSLADVRGLTAGGTLGDTFAAVAVERDVVAVGRQLGRVAAVTDDVA